MEKVEIISDVHALLLKRHKERLEKFEARRQARLKEKSESKETSESFMLSFNKEKREITLLLNKLDDTQPKLEVSSSFEELSQKIQMLQKFVSNSLRFLPGYDMRRAQNILKKLRDDVSVKRELLLPKKKFAFKSRQKLILQTGSQTTSPDQLAGSKNDVSLKLSDNVGFSDHCNESLTLEQSECNNKDLYISNLIDCTVHVYGCPSAIRIEKLINTTIFSGPVNRSIFINDCFDCNFHLACQQLRIHTTVNSKFYIHVTSKAIIEDCEDVGFASYTWNYEKILEHFESASLDKDVNNWSDVDDFNWLKLDEQSPNWYIIEKTASVD